MIAEPILRRLRNGVCAVGYLVAPLTDYYENYEVADQFRVIGTGFVIQREIVLTNRHVVDALEQATREYSNPSSQQFVQFVVPKQSGGVAVIPRQVRHKYCLRDGSIDVAFIEYKLRVRPGQFEEVVPVEMDDPRTVRLSEEIAAFGYPHGNALMERQGRVSRWGPVLQQGWISGISPFASVDPDEFLLDLRAAEGISGSPVFRPSTGKVFGVLHSAIGPGDALTTTAFAQPVSRDLLSKWLVEFFNDRQSGD